jgi:methionyl-tRNA synthetase
MISFSDFQKLDLVVGEVKECSDHPRADKLILLHVDVGGMQKQLVAGIKGHYSPEELVGKRIIVVNNLEPATLRGERSDGMLLAATDPEGKVVLLTLDRDAPAGSKVS